MCLVCNLYSCSLVQQLAHKPPSKQKLHFVLIPLFFVLQNKQFVHLMEFFFFQFFQYFSLMISTVSFIWTDVMCESKGFILNTYLIFDAIHCIIHKAKANAFHVYHSCTKYTVQAFLTGEIWHLFLHTGAYFLNVLHVYWIQKIQDNYICQSFLPNNAAEILHLTNLNELSKDC